MEDEGLLGILDSAEHRMIRDTVREFCEEEIRPIAQEIEDEHRFPDEVFADLNDLDMMGVPISEEYGGLGGDQLMYALVTEELGRVSGGSGSRTPPTRWARSRSSCSAPRNRRRRLRPTARRGGKLGAWRSRSPAAAPTPRTWTRPPSTTPTPANTC